MSWEKQYDELNAIHDNSGDFYERPRNKESVKPAASSWRYDTLEQAHLAIKGKKKNCVVFKTDYLLYPYVHATLNGDSVVYEDGGTLSSHNVVFVRRTKKVTDSDTGLPYYKRTRKTS